MPVEEQQVATAAHRFEDALSRVLRGKPRPIRLTLICLLADGHLLIEDAPGVGKTSLAKAVGTSFGRTLQRLQFTPGWLPHDVIK